MKNAITLTQYKKLVELADAFNAATEQDDNALLVMLTTAEGDGPEPEETAEMLTFEAYDWDDETDYDTLRSMLREVGVELDETTLLSGYEAGRLQSDGEWTPQAYSNGGDASFGNKWCRCYAYCLPLIK